MKRTFLYLVTLAAALTFAPNGAPAQTTTNTSAPDSALPAIPEGFIVLNGKVFIVRLGRADRIDADATERAAKHGIVNLGELPNTLRARQMLTMEGKIIRLPDSVVFTHSPAAEEDARAAATAATAADQNRLLVPARPGTPAMIPGAATSSGATSGSFGNPTSGTNNRRNPNGTINANATGTINADGTTSNANGSTINANGSITNANGTTTNANGTTTNANGTTTNGTTTNANGTTTNANSTTTNANGSTTSANGTTSTGSRAISNGSGGGGTTGAGTSSGKGTGGGQSNGGGAGGGGAKGR